MKIIMTAILTLSSMNLFAASINQFHGRWSGYCVHQNYNSDITVNPYVMTLNVAPIENSQNLKWQISYGNQPLRDYVLKPATSQLKNHYVLDEQNGILIDMFLVNGEMNSLYSINGKVFQSVLRLHDSQTLIATGSSYWAKPINTTHTAPDTNVVHSFAVRDTHKCKLKARPQNLN